MKIFYFELGNDVYFFNKKLHNFGDCLHTNVVSGGELLLSNSIDIRVLLFDVEQ